MSRARRLVIAPNRIASVESRGRVDALRHSAPSRQCSPSGSSSSSPAATRARSSRRSSRTPSRSREPPPSRCGTTCSCISATAPTARSRSSSSSRRAPRRPRSGASLTRAVKRAVAVVPHGGTGQFDLARTPGGAMVVYGDVQSRAEPRRGEGLHRRRHRGARASRRRRPRLRHRRRSDPARPRPDLPVRPRARRADDRGADRAARPARGLRPLLGGDDPADLRRLHDHRHARDRLRRRAALGDPDVRDEPRAADRPRDRGRLLAADRLPLPGGARGAARTIDDAVVRTMETAGRAVVFSGHRGRARPRAAPRDAAAVHPDARRRRLPDPDRLDRRRGHAPAGAAPELLRPARHGPASHPARRARLDPDRGFWARLSRTIMARPIAFLVARDARCSSRWPRPRSGSSSRPARPSASRARSQSVQGFDLLRVAVGSGAVAPSQILVAGAAGRRARAADAGGGAAARRGARARPGGRRGLHRRGGPFVDSSRTLPSRCSSRAATTTASRRRRRSCTGCATTTDPGGRLPRGVDVCSSAAARRRASTSSHRAYTYFPPLIAAVLVLTYLLLMRAFRSLLLPLKAVLLEPALGRRRPTGCSSSSSAGASAQSLLGLYQFDQVEGWIPIFLFAMLFGLSMDYEVFLVTRMREAWDEGADNETRGRARARAHGPDHHRRGDHHVRRVLGLPRRAASSACRSSGSASRSRSSSTRRSSAASSCRA